MTQAGLICLMVWTVIPVLCIPAAWRDNRGWRRVGAVALCIVLYLLLAALTAGYAVLEADKL